MSEHIAFLWGFIARGLAFTICVETPVLMAGLSKPHSMLRRMLAGIWLNACSYPIVILALPLILPNRTLYIIVAETFAALGEAGLFALAFHPRGMPARYRIQDWITIILANQASFLGGLLVEIYFPRFAQSMGL